MFSVVVFLEKIKDAVGEVLSRKPKLDPYRHLYHDRLK
jgi:hypothetical protein